MRKAKRPSARRAQNESATGCGVVQKWSMLSNTAGYVQVWVPVKKYDAVAKDFAKKMKGKFANQMLRQRLVPLAVESVCSGTCDDGANCAWILIRDAGSAKLYVCDCQYVA